MAVKYVAYQGDKFTIEWYFDRRGKSQAFEYFEKLPLIRKKKLIHLFYILGDIGKVFNKEKFRYEGNQIYALKPAPDRFLCFFFEGSKVIVTNAYEKKSAKIPIKEKERALKFKEDYKKRCKGETYYG